MDNHGLFNDNEMNLGEGIQEFGYLLITDLNDILVAGSENCEFWIGEEVSASLGKNIWDILSEHFEKYVGSIKLALKQVIDEINERVLLEVYIKAEPYYLNIYLFNQSIYFEFEKKFEDSNVFFPKFEIIDKLLSENKGNIWNAVCSFIFNISGFDRVRIFQYVDENNGLIIAESLADEEQERLIGSYYPDMDIFRLAKNVHDNNYQRYTPDVNRPTIRLISKSDTKPNLSHTNIQMVSPIHAKYLLRDDVKANLSVSIQINGEIWGYVFCQSKNDKKVNLLIREAIVYFIQIAVNRFTEELKAKTKDFQVDIRNFELQLKEKLILKNNLVESLMDLEKELCYYAKADSMVLLINGEIYTYNISIGFNKIMEIKKLISKISSKSIFSDPKFTLNYGEELELDSERFVGLAALNVDSVNKCSIFWFRKEKEFYRKWVAMPKSRIDRNLPNEFFEQEKHQLFDIWHQRTTGTSEAWNEDEIYFIGRLKELIIQSNKNFSQEIDKLKKEVGHLHMALDNYANTVSHDLKNPLSAINLSTQMLLQHADLTEDIKDKMLKNTKDAVDVISELLRSIHEFSKVKGFEYKMEPVYVDEFIAQIFNFTKLRYDASQTKIIFGKILPVFGEKTIIYQLFQNIIGNAIKYSVKVDHPLVSISSCFKHEFVRYTIQDNGIGIAKEELSTIYDSFKRMSNANNYEGTGLGLTIAKRIADRLHINIEVESELGKGTSVHLLFPIEIGAS